MNEVHIVPYISVDEYLFNSRQKEIEKKFGQASKATIDNIMNNMIEYRSALELTYQKARSVYRLASVICTQHTNPLLGGLSIFDAGLNALKELDNDFVDGPQYTTFKNLGITVGGMGSKKIPEKRLVVAFSKESLFLYSQFPLV